MSGNSASKPRDGTVPSKRTGVHRYGIALLIPIAILVASGFQHPYVLGASLAPPKLGLPAMMPTLLYRLSTHRVSYTSESLRSVGLKASARNRPEAILFAIWAKDERSDLDLLNLPWFRSLQEALRLQDPPLGQLSRIDREMLQDFTDLFRGASKVPRGNVVVFDLPEGATFRRETGISAIVPLAIRIPIGSAARHQNGVDLPSDQQVDVALRRSFEVLGELGISSVGIAHFHVPDQIGDPPNIETSWSNLLHAVDHIAPGSGVTRVILGGFSPRGSELRDRGLQEAWTHHRSNLEELEFSLADSASRLAALTMTLALLAAWRRRIRLTAKYIVAIVLVSLGVLSLIEEPLDLIKVLGITQYAPALASALKIVLAGAAGWYLSAVVNFDPKKVLRSAQTTFLGK